MVGFNPGATPFANPGTSVDQVPIFFKRSDAVDPDGISGLVTWLNARDSQDLSLDGLNRVSLWTNRVSGGGNPAQGTIADRPIFSTTAMGSLPGINFDGTSDYLSYTNPGTFEDDWTIVVSCRPSANGSGSNWFEGRGIFGGEIAGVVDDFGLTLGLNSRFQSGIGNPDTTTQGRAHLLDENYVVVWTRSNSTGEVKIYVNGVLERIGIASTGSRSASTDIEIGSIRQIAGRFFDGGIGEIAVYDRIITTQERLSLESYFAYWQPYQFLPTDLSGLIFWTDPTQFNTLTLDTSNQISRLALVDGTFNDFIQNTANKRPLYNSTGVNNFPGMSFDGGDELANTSSFGAEFSIFCVNQPTAASGVQQLLAQDGGVDRNLQFRFNGTDAEIITFVSGVPVTTASVGSVSAIPNIAVCSRGSSSQEIFFNGIGNATGSLSAADTGAQNISMGARNDGTTETYTGVITTAFAYNRQVSGQERLVATDYLSDKFNIIVTN